MGPSSPQTSRPDRLSLVRGAVLSPSRDGNHMRLVPDALLEIDQTGEIIAFAPAGSDCETPVTRPGAVWLPGFIDTHVHFPQTRVIGSASGPLLDWLKTSIFPEEARFEDLAYARATAQRFCASLIAQGTTSAAIYSSSHGAATDVLFQSLFDHGLRGLVGLTLMDRAAPDELCVSAVDAMAQSEALIARWHGADDGRLEFCVTPRFAISCSPELMRAAGDLAARHGLAIQTHISENDAEIAAVGELFPEHATYLDVYAHFGLATERTILAHCVHLSDDEWDQVATKGCGVSHCPDSNFFLRSGQMPLEQVRARDVKLGLGSDVGAGRTFSLRSVASSAFDTANLTGAVTSSEELLWYATVGGAQVLGWADRVGFLEVGYAADMIAIDLPDARLDDVHALCDQLIFRHDSGPVAATYVRGRRLSS